MAGNGNQSESFGGMQPGMGTLVALGQGAAATAVAYTASGAINQNDTLVDLNQAGSSLAMTIDKPEPGKLLIITQIDAGTQGHTVTLANGTFDGTNNTATLNAQYEALILWGISEERYLILKNYGSVALSAV